MDRMAAVVPDSKSSNLQQFCHTVPGMLAVSLITFRRKPTSFLAILFPQVFSLTKVALPSRKTNRSVCPNNILAVLEKVDNCQIAVFGVLAKNQYCVPVDVKLYLPQNWIVFRTKNELAIEIVDNALRNTRFNLPGSVPMQVMEKGLVSFWSCTGDNCSF
jgi:hypothetical protein